MVVEAARTQAEPEAGVTQAPHGILARHGVAMARHARWVVLVSVLLTVVGYLVAALGVGGPSLFSRLELGEPVVAGEALEGRDLLAANDPARTSLQADWRGLDPSAPANQAAFAQVTAELGAIPGVAQVVSPSTVGPAAIATGGDGALFTVLLDPVLDAEQLAAVEDEVQVRLWGLPTRVPGSTVQVTAQSELVSEITDQVEADLKKGEGISLPISLLIMVLIFGGFAAAGVPLAGAIASIAGGLMSLLLFTYVIDLDITVVNVVTVLGLGLCIDYSLLMVSRYREQMHELWDLSEGGHEDVPPEIRQRAMAVTMATAGRTVIFSGITVAIAVTGLMFIDMTIIRSVGAGAVSVVVIAVVVATTFVPALLVLGTKHVAGAGTLSAWPGFRRFAGAFDHSPSDDGWFARWASKVQRRPWLAFLGVATALIVLSLPAWRMNLVSSGVGLLPPDNFQRQAYEQIEADYPLLTAPTVRVVAATSDRAALESLAGSVAELPGVERVGEVTVTGDVAQFGVVTSEADAADVVREVRQARPPSPQTWVTGQAAILVDYRTQLRDDVPIALGFVVLATFVLLFLLTGSVLIPIKALLMNLLSLGATFGILVLIFQDGRLEGLLGFSSAGGIESTLPVIIFAFAFGLSMDYEVFLLSRIKEFHDAGHGNDDAVRLGLQRTGRIITSAALLIVVVFAGFVLGDLLAIKQTGVALAVAVLVDATLVRIILVPATMTLLGEWNWWAPGPLRRLHDRIGVAH
ncbi:MAG TPA: MMPL family transporter [Candidatus Nanopelagicales bacterium]